MITSKVMAKIIVKDRTIKTINKDGFDYTALEGIKDPNWKMMVPLYIFVAGMILFGLFSQPIVDLFGKIGAGVL